MTRPNPDEYFMNVAKIIATRSTCKRHQIGAVAVKDKFILATGYNGAPSGLYDCLKLGCQRDQMKIESGTRQEICRAVHAEQNVIIQASTHNVSLVGSTIYCNFSPCKICAKMLINSKISRLVYETDYSDGEYKKLFKWAEIPFGTVDNKNELVGK